MELYARVRRACHVGGMSAREAARVFGVDRRTVAKMLAYAVPPGYRRNKPRAQLDPYIGVVDRFVEEDGSVTPSSGTRRGGSSIVFATNMAYRAGELPSRITFANGAVVSGRCSYRCRTLRVMPRRTLARRMRSSPASSAGHIFSL